MANIALDPVFLRRLEEIPWFQNCGREPPLPDTYPARNAGEALKGITSTRWKNMILEHRGDFTAELCLLSIRTKGGEDTRWNPLVQEFKDKHLPTLEPLWQKALEPLGLCEKGVLDDVRFDVMAIVTIDAYKEIMETPEFFRRLLAIYEAGRLPCGWKGKKAKGCFLVY